MSPDQREADQDENDSPPPAQPGPYAPGPARAIETRSRWPGWIWTVPLAALLIVGYLTMREFLQRGPLVTVTFATAGGVKAGDTKVQYQGLEVGEVESVTLEKDLHHVDVGLRLESDMDGHLGPGTRFWIAGSPDFADLASLRSIISGPFIGIDPHPGPSQKHYQGLAATPAVKQTVPGTRYTLHAAMLGNVARGSKINYRDLAVGTIEDTHLRPDGSGFDIDAFVSAPYDKLVHRASRFWNAGAVQVSLSGPGPRVQFHSVPSLFTGAIAFTTPGAGGPVATNGAQFTLYDSRDAAENAPDAEAVRYRAAFSAADAEALDAGAPVQLAGRQVGVVQSGSLRYEPGAGQLEALVTFTLEPRHIELGGGQQWQANARLQMDAMLRQLIGQGLRASLGKTVPVVGAPAVMLDFAPRSPPAQLGAGDPPLIPSGPSSNVDAIMASVGAFTAKLQSLPLDAIADDVHRATSKLAQLSDSPEVTQSLQHLDESLANVDRVTHQASTQVGPILARLHRVADEAQSAVAGAQKLLNSNGLTPTTPGTAGIGDALYELSRAARSLREFADYLDRHPEALLRGKGEQG